MFPKDFIALGTSSGLKKKKGAKDLALFYSARPAVASGMFTANIFKAAPVLVSEIHLKTGSSFRAIVANSGCANACTGSKGKLDAEAMCSAAARILKIKSGEVLAASTGVIGQGLPVSKIRKGLSVLSVSIKKGESNALSAAEAIMTTDTMPKIAAREVIIDGKVVTVWGCAKGAGMIHPDLKMQLHATMLAFVLTDAAIAREFLDKALFSAVETSFNCVSVDGDTSTNDTIIALSNGAAENEIIKTKRPGFQKFADTLNGVCLELAKMIASDGEGATHLVEINVLNAPSCPAAKKIASTIATSPLVKTAVFGCDANWGRILAACGRAGVNLNPDKVDVYIGDLIMARNGVPVKFSEKKARALLGKKEVKLTIDLHQGKGCAKYYTCDFTCEYVKINADYRS